MCTIEQRASHPERITFLLTILILVALFVLPALVDHYAECHTDTECFDQHGGDGGPQQ